MSNWDLEYLRKIAGVAAPVQAKQNLTESIDDDDEDPDVKIASEDKRQRAFEKKNKQQLKQGAAKADEMTKAQKAAAAEKKAAAGKAKAAEVKKPDPKPEQKKEEAETKAEDKKEVKPAEDNKAEEKKEVAAAEAKRRGKAPNENSFNQQAKAHAKTHTRGSFLKWAAETHGKGKHYASALFAKYNPKSSREVKEAAELWGISHPYLKGYMLAENRELNQMQWVDGTSPFIPAMYVTEAEAQKVATYMSEWKSQAAVVEHFDFSDLEDDAE